MGLDLEAAGYPRVNKLTLTAAALALLGLASIAPCVDEPEPTDQEATSTGGTGIDLGSAGRTSNS